MTVPQANSRGTGFLTRNSDPAPTQYLAAAITLLLAVLPAVLWPGDTPWILDEPAEVAIAFQANQHHELASHGLTGNFHLQYGPLPMQLYQAMLLVSHDPRVLVVLRGIFCSLVTAGSLLWLGRTLRLNLWFAAAVVLAPHLWYNNRILWAASVSIPIGTLAVAAYAAFLRGGSGRSLILAVGATIAPLFIHPQAAPLSAAILGHILWRQRPALWRHRLGILAVLALLAFLNSRYIQYAVKTVYASMGSSIRSGYPGQLSRGAALAGPLMGGRLFSGGEFHDDYCQLDGPRLLVGAARVLSSVSIPLVWLGIGLALWQLAKCRRTVPPVPSPAEPAQGDTTGNAARHTLIAIALAGLVLQSLYFGLLRVPPAPQYFFGTFPLYVVLAWTAAEALGKLRLRGWVIGAYGVSLAIITLGTMLQVHRHGWPPGTLSPTLNEQITLARQLNDYANTTAQTDVSCYQFEYPHALWVLRMLYPPYPGQPRKTTDRLVIRNLHGPTGRTGRIELLEARTAADIPSNAKPVVLYPK